MPSTERAQVAKAMNKVLNADEKTIDEELEADQRAAEKERAVATKAPDRASDLEGHLDAVKLDKLQAQMAELAAQNAALQATLARLTPTNTEALYTFPTSPRESASSRLLEMFPDGKKYPGDRSPVQMRADYVRAEWGKSQDGLPFDRCWD